MPDSPFRFLDLPGELRDRIYSEALGGTHIPFGRGVTPTVKKRKLNLLALLYTCRQIRAEIRLRWLGWVLFDFQSIEVLLNVLTKRPDTTVAAIRHVRVSSRPLQLLFPEACGYYGLLWIFKLVSQLQLHTLTILGGYTNYNSRGPAEADYDTINDLIMYGTGCKELYYISPDSSVLSFQTDEPQLQTWRSKLTHRDGSDSNSGASVDVYRSKTNIAGAIINGNELEPYEYIGQEQVPDLTKPGEADKEVLVVIKRGKKADIRKEVDLGHVLYDVPAPGLSWAKIRDRIVGEGDEHDMLGFIDDGYNQCAMDRRWSQTRQEFYRWRESYRCDADEAGSTQF